MEVNEGASEVADPTIDYKLLADVDMRDVDGLDDAALEAHFAGLAGKASVRQLSRFLDGQSFATLGEDTHGILVRRYVERRMHTVAHLREARKTFGRSLSGLLGDEP